MSYQPESFIQKKDIILHQSLTSGMCLISAFVTGLNDPTRLTESKVLAEVSKYIDYVVKKSEVSLFLRRQSVIFLIILFLVR